MNWTTTILAKNNSLPIMSFNTVYFNETNSLPIVKWTIAQSAENISTPAMSWTIARLAKYISLLRVFFESLAGASRPPPSSAPTGPVAAHSVEAPPPAATPAAAPHTQSSMLISRGLTYSKPSNSLWSMLSMSRLTRKDNHLTKREKVQYFR